MHLSRFALAKRTSANLLSVSPQRNSKTHGSSRVHVFVFLFLRFASAKRISAGSQKIGTTFVHAHFVRFALAKRTKQKCALIFEHFASAKRRKNWNRIRPRLFCAFRLSKAYIFNKMLTKPQRQRGHALSTLFWGKNLRFASAKR